MTGDIEQDGEVRSSKDGRKNEEYRGLNPRTRPVISTATCRQVKHSTVNMAEQVSLDFWWQWQHFQSIQTCAVILVSVDTRNITERRPGAHLLLEFLTQPIPLHGYLLKHRRCSSPGVEVQHLTISCHRWNQPGYKHSCILSRWEILETGWRVATTKKCYSYQSSNCGQGLHVDNCTMTHMVTSFSRRCTAHFSFIWSYSNCHLSARLPSSRTELRSATTCRI